MELCFCKVSKVGGRQFSDGFGSTTTGTISPSPDAVESLERETLREYQVIQNSRVDVTITHILRGTEPEQELSVGRNRMSLFIESPVVVVERRDFKRSCRSCGFLQR